jgi:hypothetical protein
VVSLKLLNSIDKKTGKSLYGRAKDGTYYIQSSAPGKKITIDRSCVDFRGKGKTTGRRNKHNDTDLVDAMKKASIKQPPVLSYREYQKHCERKLTGPNNPESSRHVFYYCHVPSHELYAYLKKSGRFMSCKAV